MKVYLAGHYRIFGQFCEEINYDFNRLQSYFYARKDDERAVIPRYRSYMLDSGAFTFIMAKQQNKKELLKMNIDDFTKDYCDYIVENNIDDFFEMDVDIVYGYKKVLQLRDLIMERTGKKPIPVFHAKRGKEEWMRHLEDFPHVALAVGGKDTSFTDWKTFQWFARSAIEASVKCHGLGITGMTVLENVSFTSVDSSSWTAGNRFGEYFHFDAASQKILSKKDKRGRIHNHDALARHNFIQWIKFANCVENRDIIR